MVETTCLSLHRFHWHAMSCRIFLNWLPWRWSLGGPTASMGTGWTEAPDQRKGGGRQGRMEQDGNLLDSRNWFGRPEWFLKVPQSAIVMVCYAKKPWSSEINGTIVQLSFTYMFVEIVNEWIWQYVLVDTCSVITWNDGYPKDSEGVYKECDWDQRIAFHAQPRHTKGEGPVFHQWPARPKGATLEIKFWDYYTR